MNYSQMMFMVDPTFLSCVCMVYGVVIVIICRGLIDNVYCYVGLVIYFSTLLNKGGLNARISVDVVP